MHKHKPYIRSILAKTNIDVLGQMGGLDILVNSGGVWTEAMLRNPSSERAFLDAFTMHVASVSALVDAAAPHLTANGVRPCASSPVQTVHAKNMNMTATPLTTAIECNSDFLGSAHPPIFREFFAHASPLPATTQWSAAGHVLGNF